METLHFQYQNKPLTVYLVNNSYWFSTTDVFVILGLPKNLYSIHFYQYLEIPDIVDGGGGMSLSGIAKVVSNNSCYKTEMFLEEVINEIVPKIINRDYLELQLLVQTERSYLKEIENKINSILKSQDIFFDVAKQEIEKRDVVIKKLQNKNLWKKILRHFGIIYDNN
jgi:hypothetical protein